MSRKFARIMTLVICLAMTVSALGACTSASPSAAPSAAPTEQASAAATASAAPASAYKQAPSFEGQNLPPVDQRLPENPLVVTPHESVGVYGGTWRQSIVLGAKWQALATIGYYEGRNFVVWNEDMSKIVPNLAEKFEISPDATTYTFTLRKGLKWSDGQPMTTADVKFWYDTCYVNTEYNPGYATADPKLTVEIVDEQTFKMIYNKPMPLLLTTLAEFSWSTYFLPEHYLKQFVPATASDANDKAKVAGFDSWVKYLNDRIDYTANPDLPTMCPWTLKTQGAAATQLEFDRNPYYWAVDTEGNQLPYMDKCVVNIVESGDVAKMKAVAGEFEVAVATVMENFADYPLFAENAEKGGYTVKTVPFAEPNAMNIHFNLGNKDEAVRAIMDKVEFRQAMSLAIDRDKIIAANFTVGPEKAEKRQFSPYPNSPYFDKDLSTQYTEFDLAKANQMLDALGLDKKDGNGIRLLPNGKPFTMSIIVPSYDPSWIDIGTMLADCWKAAGINATATSVDPALWIQRLDGNDWDCTIMTGGGGLATDASGEIDAYTAYNAVNWPTRYQTAYINYRTSGGTSGVQPPDSVKQLWDLGSKIVVEPDKAKRDDMIKQVLQIYKDNLFVLGIGTRLPAIYLVKNNVHNVPDLNVAWNFGSTGHGRPEQYYIK